MSSLPVLSDSTTAMLHIFFFLALRGITSPFPRRSKRACLCFAVKNLDDLGVYKYLGFVAVLLPLHSVSFLFDQRSSNALDTQACPALSVHFINTLHSKPCLLVPSLDFSKYQGAGVADVLEYLFGLDGRAVGYNYLTPIGVLQLESLYPPHMNFDFRKKKAAIKELTNAFVSCARSQTGIIDVCFPLVPRGSTFYQN